MQSLTLVVVVALAAAAHALPSGDLYDSKYDNVDLDEIITNKRLLHPYILCCLDKGKCSPDGKLLKSHIKEAIETYCEKCTPAQKAGTRKIIRHLINEEPDYWTQLCDKYDKERKYSTRYETELRTLKTV